jgi:hypothetical protein
MRKDKMRYRWQAFYLFLSFAYRASKFLHAATAAIKSDRNKTPVKPTAFFGHGHGGVLKPCVRRPFSYARESRVSVCAKVCSVDKSSSLHKNLPL